MHTIAMLTYAAEMTQLADNGCCTITLCTQRPRLTWRKTRLGEKKI